MNIDDRLSPRERDEIRDLIVAGTQRLRPAWGQPAQALAAGFALLLIGALTGAILTSALRGDGPSVPADVAEPAANGWVAFAAGQPSDIYLVMEGSPAHRLTGASLTNSDEACPAFSRDGSRLAFGRTTGQEDAGRDTAAVVFGEVSADGALSAPVTIELDDMKRLPCPTWSADGRWLAFGAGAYHKQSEPHFVDEVWLLDTETRDIRRLTGYETSDLEWAPDGSELYLATDGGVIVYSVATHEGRPVPASEDVVALAVSPDGRALAVQRNRAGWRSKSDTGAELWLMATDGSGQHRLGAHYRALHGIGPVWAPDGSRIAFQRSCSRYVDVSGNDRACREQSEVVVIPISGDNPLGDVGSQLVINPPRTTQDGTSTVWFPFSVTWSPDSTTLLYLAWTGGDDASDWTHGVVAVRVDGSAPPAVLHDSREVGAYSGFPWTSFQSWGTRNR